MSMQRFEVESIPGGVEIFLIDMDRKSFIFEGITLQQMASGIRAYMGGGSGGLIQNAFNFLTSDQREFLMTGITPDEWNEIFKDSDEDDL